MISGTRADHDHATCRRGVGANAGRWMHHDRLSMGRALPYSIRFPTVTRKFRGDRMDDVNWYLEDGGDFFDR